MLYIRPPWDDYFMDITFQVAKRSTCDRARVGAVIVKDKRILTKIGRASCRERV